MADDDHAESRPAVDAGRLPVPGADRQRAYRRGRATRSLDVSGHTHGLLRQLCDRDGIGIDAALRSALEVVLEHTQADLRVMEAAWTYLNAARASYAEFYHHDYLTERRINSVELASAAFNEAIDNAGDLSPVVRGRALWLVEQGQGRVNQVDANSVPAAPPQAVSARHGTLDDVAQTILAGGMGISLNNMSLVMLPAADEEPGGSIVRVRAPPP